VIKIKKKILAALKSLKTSGILATRALVVLLLVPILLVILAYVLAFTQGFVSDSLSKLIDTGLKIIDHIFIPSVLTAVVGFLALWVDRDGDGVPDKLEEDKKL